MKNKEQKIVRLLEEGFSYETIKKMSNLHINKIYESLDEVESYNTKTDVFDKDTEGEEFNNTVNSAIQKGEKIQVGQTETGDKTVTLKNEGEVSEDDVDNCLLYTSPSPRDLSTSRMPSSA